MSDGKEIPELSEKIVRTYYRSWLDGQVWCEDRDPLEVIKASRDYDGVTYEKLEIVEVNDGWMPWNWEEEFKVKE